MRRIILSILAVAALVLSAAPAPAETGNSASASAAVMSTYMWRGLRLSEGVVVQPSVDFNYGAFNMNMWANYDADTNAEDYPEDGSVVNELDVTLAYALPLEALDVSVGYIYYSVLGTDTQEAYVSASKGLGPVTPYVNFYYDYDLGTGSYTQAGLDYSSQLSENLSLSLGGYVSYLAYNKVVGSTEADGEYKDMHNAEVSVALAYTAGDLSIEPMVAYTFPLSDAAEEAMTDGKGDDSHVYGGVTVGLGF